MAVNVLTEGCEAGTGISHIHEDDVDDDEEEEEKEEEERKESRKKVVLLLLHCQPAKEASEISYVGTCMMTLHPIMNNLRFYTFVISVITCLK